MATKVASLYVELEARTAELESQLSKVENRLKGTGDSAKNTGFKFTELQSKLNLTKQAFQGVGQVIEFTANAINEGAQLQLARSQYENLAESIGTTADALLIDMREATSGMMSDAALIAGATDIINTGLTSTHEDTVRLATAVGTLGLDMQQVILTFANNSKARLDSLGLSISDVDEKTQNFIAAGMDANEAFDTAVLEALEDKMALLGDTAGTTAGSIAKLQASQENLTNSFNEFMAIRWEPIITGLSNTIDVASSNWEILTREVERGNLSQIDAITIMRDATTGFSHAQERLARLREQEEKRIRVLESVNIEQVRLNNATETLTAQVDAYTRSLSSSTSMESQYAQQARETINNVIELQQAIAAYTRTQEEGTGLADMYADRQRAVADAQAHSAVVTGIAREKQDALNQAQADFVNTLIAVPEKLEEYTSITGDAATNADLLNRKLFEQVQASSDSAAEIIIAGEALGIFSEAEADAMMKAAFLEEAIRRQREAWDGTAEGMIIARDNILEYIDELNNIPDVTETEVRTNYTQTGTPPGASVPGGVAMPPGVTAPDSMNAAGGDFIVPPGFPGDSFMVGVTSGERVRVDTQTQQLNDSDKSGATYIINTQDNTARVVEQLRARDRAMVISRGM